MTPDPIEAICEEMERAISGATRKRLAARLRAWWSPQRKAFVEAAEQSIVRPKESERRYWRNQMEVSYRALCESEKKP